MSNNKEQLIKFLISVKAIQFGKFKLKNNRISPYFFNLSNFNSAKLISKLGEYFAVSIYNKFPHCTCIFGPAYKGIPLSISTSIALSKLSKKDIGFFFNRKEVKSHGDKGIFVGKRPTGNDKIILVDDVITDGNTKIEALKLIHSEFNVDISSVFVTFDRMEKNGYDYDARLSFEEKTGVKVFSLTNIYEVLKIMKLNSKNRKDKSEQNIIHLIENYLRKFGNIDHEKN